MTHMHHPFDPSPLNEWSCYAGFALIIGGYVFSAWLTLAGLGLLALHFILDKYEAQREFDLRFTDDGSRPGYWRRRKNEGSIED